MGDSIIEAERNGAGASAHSIDDLGGHRRTAVTVVASSPMAVQTDPRRFGVQLKRWRTERRFSQHELALRSEVSQRHLSYLENGRSRPSPEMIEHLSIALDVPLRARNSLFVAAGFAPAHSEEPMDGDGLADLRRSLQRLVDAHHPFPAYVVDRCWNLQLSNEAAAMMTMLLVDPGLALEFGGNILRMALHPEGLKRHVPNWPVVAASLVDRLRRECELDPSDSELAALADEVRRYPGMDALPDVAVSGGDQLLTELHVLVDGRLLRLYTTVMSLTAARDITVSEIRLETLLPADAASERVLRDLAGSPAG